MVRYQLIKTVNAVNEITQHAISFKLFGTLVIFGKHHSWAPNEILFMGPRVRRDLHAGCVAGGVYDTAN